MKKSQFFLSVIIPLLVVYLLFTLFTMISTGDVFLPAEIIAVVITIIILSSIVSTMMAWGYVLKNTKIEKAIIENGYSYKELIQNKMTFYYCGIHHNEGPGNRFLLTGNVGNKGQSSRRPQSMIGIPIEQKILRISDIVFGDKCLLVYNEEGDLSLKKVEVPIEQTT